MPPSSGVTFTASSARPPSQTAVKPAAQRISQPWALAFVCPLGPAVGVTARPTQRLFRLVLESHNGCLGADSEEKREPVSDIDTAVVDSLKVLDLKWPIREADISEAFQYPHLNRYDALQNWHIGCVNVSFFARRGSHRGDDVELRSSLSRRGSQGCDARLSRLYKRRRLSC